MLAGQPWWAGASLQGVLQALLLSNSRRCLPPSHPAGSPSSPPSSLTSRICAAAPAPASPAAPPQTPPLMAPPPRALRPLALLPSLWQLCEALLEDLARCSDNPGSGQHLDDSTAEAACCFARPVYAQPYLPHPCYSVCHRPWTRSSTLQRSLLDGPCPCARPTTCQPSTSAPDVALFPLCPRECFVCTHFKRDIARVVGLTRPCISAPPRATRRVHPSTRAIHQWGTSGVNPCMRAIWLDCEPASSGSAAPGSCSQLGDPAGVAAEEP